MVNKNTCLNLYLRDLGILFYTQCTVGFLFKQEVIFQKSCKRFLFSISLHKILLKSETFDLRKENGTLKTKNYCTATLTITIYLTFNLIHLSNLDQKRAPLCVRIVVHFVISAPASFLFYKTATIRRIRDIIKENNRISSNNNKRYALLYC